jgi:Fe-S-cluster containining protein
MTHAERLTILNRFYQIHDRFVTTLRPACHRGCRTCCTRNLTITTLEGEGVIAYLKTTGRTDLKTRMVKAGSNTRFVPEITTNQLARLCSRGEDPPEEVTAPLEKACSLLENDACTIYPARPLGCRSLVSTTVCRETGFAEVDPFTFTLNTVFLQFTEHLDQEGYTGNLTDILLHLWRQETVGASNFSATPPEHLLTNLPIPMLLVPPEHGATIAPWITALQQAAFVDKS